MPPKICTYSCIYCQVGRTTRVQVRRQGFFDPEMILEEVAKRLASLSSSGEPVDFVTLVPDGEPTLDANLGSLIGGLKSLGHPVAVLTNGSLLWQDDLREALAAADWVSLKVDAASEKVWRRVDRPHRRLSLPVVYEGMLEFAHHFRGVLVTETMLVGGVNEGPQELERMAAFLGRLQPAVAYVAVPTRPPAEAWVQPPEARALARAHVLLSRQVPRVELLIGYEGDAFSATGDAASDLLAITAVHPMRHEAVEALLQQTGADWITVQRLLDDGRLVALSYQGERYFMRALPSRARA